MSSECFAAAVKLIISPLRGYTRRLAHDGGEDLVQDTLVRAWNARSRFEPGTNFKAWLFRIARNVFLSGLRRSGRSLQWDPDLHDQLLISGPSQDEGLYMGDFERALDCLPSIQREALLLITREGLSYEEAAMRTGQELGTVKSRVFRARVSLTAYFAES